MKNIYNHLFSWQMAQRLEMEQPSGNVQAAKVATSASHQELAMYVVSYPEFMKDVTWVPPPLFVMQILQHPEFRILLLEQLRNA